MIRPAVDKIVPVKLDAIRHPHVAYRGVSSGGLSENFVIARRCFPPAFLFSFRKYINGSDRDTVLIKRDAHRAEVCLNEARLTLDIFRFFSKEFLLVGEYHLSGIGKCDLRLSELCVKITDFL